MALISYPKIFFSNHEQPHSRAFRGCKNRASLRPALRLHILILLLALIAVFALSNSIPRLRARASIILSDGRDLFAGYSGDQSLQRQLDQNLAHPLAMTSADFDRDGTPDLISAYSIDGGGIITLNRGNVDYIYPNAPQARQRKSQGALTDSPFLSPALIFSIEVLPEFIAAGDFDADGYFDLLASARGSNRLCLLSGDGRGEFKPARHIALPGKLTALISGEVNRRDGLADVVAGVDGKDGAQALVFEGPEGALNSVPEAIALPQAATALAVARLDNEPDEDVAIAAGRELLIVSGRNRKLSLDKKRQSEASQLIIRRQALPFSVKSMAPGNFRGGGEPELALLADDGTVHWLSPAQTTGNRRDGIGADAKWNVEPLTRNPSLQASQLIQARMSSSPLDDLVLIDSTSNQLHILRSSNETSQQSNSANVAARANAFQPAQVSESIDLDAKPVAVLLMRLDPDGLSDLVALRKNRCAPVVMMTAKNKGGVASQLITQSATFSNSSAITINDNTIATPYPSTIPVSGLTGAVAQVTVTLNNLTHRYTKDIDVLLVGPGGQNSILMSDAGSVDVDDVTLTFDDSASESLPDLGQILQGTFKPTDYTEEEDVDSFPTPAPSGPYGSVLSVFNGTDSNGDWNLYIFDDISEDFGTVAGGWSLTITMTTPPGPVTNTDDSGPGSLRQAILDANAHPGADTITFNIATGAQVIIPASPLPDITDILTIDGTTQPGFAGTPLIELSGQNLAAGSTGLKVTAGSSTIRTLAVNRFSIGVDLESGGSNIVEGSFIGTDITGTQDLGNDVGIRITSPANLIGGTTSAARNVISGNRIGITITMNGNQVRGNHIGISATGVALANSFAGVGIGFISLDNEIFAATPTFDNTVGGTIAGASNVISGNGTGILIRQQANLVQGNFIGTDVAGNLALGNTDAGVRVLALHADEQGPDTRPPDDNLIGGTSPAARNIISGNAIGVEITSGSTDQQIPDDNTVQGNYIGTDVTGAQAVANTGDGVSLQIATDTIIGGATASARNIISGNGGHGISFIGAVNSLFKNSGIQVMGNYIGTDVAGSESLGNGGNGIFIDKNALDNDIGGQTASAGNIIAHNIGAGVRLPTTSELETDPVGVSIQSNSIYSNGGMGIDLGDEGETANDDLDPDPGPNTLQNHPVITSVTSSGGTTHIVGNLNSAPDKDFLVQFFSSSQCSSSGASQNQDLLTLPLLFHTDANGNAPIDLTLPVTLNAGFVNCLATDPMGNTSEFSPCAQVNSGGGCSFNLLPTRKAFSITGGESSLTVIATAGCNWAASSLDSWITVETPGGSGNGTLNFIVRDNFTGRFRTGTISVVDQVFTVNQDGGEAENCNYAITPSFQSFSASGGEGSFTVITGEECIWEAVSNVSWVTITSDNNGLGTGSVTFTVEANAGASGRKGTITVGSQSFSVKQKGSG